MTEAKILEVKQLLKNYKPLPAKISERNGALSLRDIASIVGASFYSVWKIWDSTRERRVLNVTHVDNEYFDLAEHDDWIVGGKIDQRDRRLAW